MEMQLAGSYTTASFAEADEFRLALQVLAQATRFQIFRLISANPGQLSLDDVCFKCGGSREKLYHHLYQMLRVGVIIADADVIGKKRFSPNEKFLSQGKNFFRLANSNAISNLDHVSHDKSVSSYEGVASTLTD